MKAIIIAAGTGSRLGSLTEGIPKCLLDINGTSILENTLELLGTNNIKDIGIVVGHQANKIQIKDVQYFENRDYKNNNILHSLMCAKKFMDDDLIITYSDIWLEAPLLEQIVTRRESLVVSVDTYWKENYIGRTDHPISQAENAVYDDHGILRKIGKHIDPEAIEENYHCGEFIGLFKLSKQFCNTFINVFEDLNRSHKKEQPFQNSESWEKSYITDFFSELLERGYPLYCSLHRKQWFEIDTGQDYEKLLRQQQEKTSHIQ